MEDACEHGGSAQKSIAAAIERNRSMMLNYAITLTRYGSLDADDIVQEACVTAYKKANSFDATKDFGPWLRGIVRLKALEASKANEQLAKLHDPDVVAGIEDVFQMLDTGQAEKNWQDKVKVLIHCVEKLPYTLKQAILMFYQQKRTLIDIALFARTSSENVGQRLSRARKQIKACVRSKTK